ncbi:large conductance mechanosensitive channel protein MscL [Thermus thermamylovorans]|uniref:Large-conductance mechanosensitive channel n=1 Tax=Thermus thermamylovorans TaxID=2509362 RepID=A0A4Q9B6A9_9DEIN|nr:large conductance mechanosensitive channel protein MscL [Thermus thermamylovorans]TBH21492.1 large conductance mechanosensitive channel protein MscL [Thermus thermamylovorans]
MLKGFRDFLMRGNVVDLAVAVVIGGAFGQVVNSLVADVLTPLIGALGGAPDFSALKLGPVAVGKFVNALVNFVVVGVAIYFLVVVPMQGVQKRLKREAEAVPSPPPEPPEEVRLLREILAELRKRA